MFEGRCHCGATGFQTDVTPKQLVDCNCSVCRKLGVLWAHLPVNDVEVIGKTEETIAYSHGDKNLAFHSCRTCGCTSRWVNLDPKGDVMAVNFRLVDPAQAKAITVRRFDGAETWKFLD